jgi:methylenetetrahydrofolate dehydrogenase (NADP+)/methenyltetrahydrofolate cyclohydrolase
MSSTIIDGKKIAEKLNMELSHKIALLGERYHLTPGLAVILVGEDPASDVYVRNKIKYSKQVGIHSFEYRMHGDTSQKMLIAKIEHLNNDPKVHGILIQLPLPKHIDEIAVINSIEPNKDVDGFSSVNAGKLVTGQDGLFPCTPLGCMKLIKLYLKDLCGLKAVIIGRSNIVGKPMANLLLREDCTLTVVHSKTANIINEVSSADILISAAGAPKLVKKEWVKPGAFILDVGITRVSLGDGNTRLVGDVDFDNVKDITSYITPVPGGVGPMTIACLLENTMKAACRLRNIKDEDILN